VRSWPLAILVLGCGGSSSDPPDSRPVVPDAAAPDAEVLPPVDCAAVPAGPRPAKLLDRHHPVEDLAFDAEHLVWSDGTHLYRSPRVGAHQVFVPNLAAREGIRILPTGDFVVADRDGGRLLRVDQTGAVVTVLSSLSFPDGIEVDRAGLVYLTDLGTGQVLRVDPYTNEFTVLVDQQIEAPDGITFDPEFEHLYIGGVAGVSTIFRLAVAADGTPGALETYVTDVGSGQYDGIATDACGNLYICDLADSKVYRVAPDKTVSVVVDRTATHSYMTSVQWGSGVGDWDTRSIYIPDVGYGLLEVDVGVPEKSRAP
jgi:hypothetical protein